MVIDPTLNGREYGRSRESVEPASTKENRQKRGPN